MKDPVLVILAAGMGSRYGGLKQIDTVGNNGESIIDFSIYDAIQAGFKKVILIIRKEHETAFEEALGKKIRPFIEVEYCFQDMDDLPEGFERPEGREKPWGTTHALLSLKGMIDGPFMIINADDYYGRDSFKVIRDFLVDGVGDEDFSMVGFILENTLTDHGTVSRAVCNVEDGCLSEIVERTKIMKTSEGASYTEDDENWIPLPKGSLVSMNYWGFTPKVLDYCEGIFTKFLVDNLEGNPMKCEHVIPTAVSDIIRDTDVKVHMLESTSRWFGVTYQEDKPYVMEMLAKYKEDGLYPFDLWKK